MTLIVLSALGAVLALPAAYNLIRRPEVRRMAVRNATRRPVETALVIIGSALATAIIAAAVMVGDTFDSAIRDIARSELGEVDLILEIDDQAERLAALEVLETTQIDGVDGAMRIRRVTAAAMGSSPDAGSATAGEFAKVEPRVTVATDAVAAGWFGSDPGRYALPNAVEYMPERLDVPVAVINTELAQTLDVGIDDRVTVFAANIEHELTVVEIVETQGLGGMADVWVTDEWFNRLDIPESILNDAIAVSYTGTVFDSVEELDPMNHPDGAISEALAKAHPEIVPTFHPVKKQLLDDAAAEGDNLTTTFSVVGGFSVLAGILLLVNLFVMLSEERKPNLGVMRAIGWKRSALRRAFRAEGLLYALPAAVVGSLAGIGLGAIMVAITRRVFESSFPDGRMELRPTIEPVGLITAALVGLVIAMAAISVTSWRISRLNIVSAIRDLPEPRRARSGLVGLLAGLALVGLGGLALVAGLGGPNVYLAIVSVPAIALGVVLVVRSVLGTDRLGTRGSMTLTVLSSVATLVWGVLFFEIVDADEVDVEFFLVYGVVLVAAGVALATVAGTALHRLAGRTDLGGVATRLALAYPTSRLLRTASSLAMYSLIIFSLAFMAIMSRSVQASSETMLAATSAGFDIVASSNASYPVTAAELGAVEGIDTATVLSQAWVEFDPVVQVDRDTPIVSQSSRITSPDPAILEHGGVVLAERSDRFDSDLEALAYVMSSGDATLVPTWFLDMNGVSADLTIGDVVTAHSTDGTATHDLEIVGLTSNDIMWSGAWVGPEAIEILAPDRVPALAYVGAAEGSDPQVVADRLESVFRRQGVEAETFTGRVNRILAVDLGFFELLRGYLLLGLVIGIGGLAVTLFRAVRERRRQIGMLRSMGMAVSGVRRWFLGEAGFVSVMGVVCGVTLGVLSGYFVVTQSGALDEDQLPFEMPWIALAIIAAIPLAASALASIIPARRAAALLPSQALRLAD